MKKYAGFVYEWTNNITGMRYIGSHCGLETDKYTGSGNLFKLDLKKYGMLNYTRIILEYVDNAKDIKSAEDNWLEKVDAKNNPGYFNRSNKSSQFKRPILATSTVRTICQHCNQRPRAIAYTKANGTPQYRRLCEHCIRLGKRIKTPEPRWRSAGYKKKSACDRCGFNSKFSAQLVVYHTDGNMNNAAVRNLKTVCQNCVVEIAKADLPWRPGDLEPDR